MQFAFLLFSLFAWGWEADLKLPPPQPVVDEANLLSAAEQQKITQILQTIKSQAGVEISVFIASSLREMAIEDFSLAVVEKWKLGEKKTDKGLLFVIAPAERKMRFEVGYGLEGEITDAFSGRVLDNEVRPYFKRGFYYEGILAGLAGIQEKVPLGLEVPKRKGIRIPNWLFLLIVIGLFFFIQLSRVLGFSGYRSRSGHWGGGYGGGGGFGGGSFGGGSWGGGGGGFGGGGASSNW
jgi:uncharacterized protein